MPCIYTSTLLHFYTSPSFINITLTSYLAVGFSRALDLLAAFQPMPPRAASCVEALEDGGGIPRPTFVRQRNIYIPGSSFLDSHYLYISPKHLSRENSVIFNWRNEYLFDGITLVLTFPLPPRNLLHPAPSRSCPAQSVVRFAASLFLFSLRRKFR